MPTYQICDHTMVFLIPVWYFENSIYIKLIFIHIKLSYHTDILSYQIDMLVVSLLTSFVLTFCILYFNKY